VYLISSYINKNKENELECMKCKLGKIFDGGKGEETLQGVMAGEAGEMASEHCFISACSTDIQMRISTSLIRIRVNTRLTSTERPCHSSGRLISTAARVRALGESCVGSAVDGTPLGQVFSAYFGIP
jgi:hypothetical protein